MLRSRLHSLLNRGKSQTANLSRRELLQAGLAAAGGLLSGVAPTACRASSVKGRRVIVVGAGFSGLACAYELASAGYDVKVLEARNRVGGRVISLKDLIPGKSVEGGGELLGSNHPHVLAYAAKFGFEFLCRSHEDEKSPIFINGRRLTNQEVNSITKEVDQVERKMTSDARAVNVDEPWATENAEQLDRRTTSEWIDGLGLSDLATKLVNVQFESENGVTTAQQSYLGNLVAVKGGGLEKYWTETEVYRLKGGNQQFAFRLARELGDERISLNCAVKQITADGDLMSVVDVSGRKHDAEEVVLAIPPSIWPTIEFIPSLPKQLTPQMGANLKYLAVVNQAFWQKKAASPAVTADGEINTIWHGTEGQASEGPYALVAFSGGTGAEAVHRRLSNEQQSAYLKSLETLLPGFGEHFVKGRLMDWMADPWTAAGYSFPAPGQITSQGPILHHGIGRLHFAGEHTCYKFVGYMEGALNSGASLAKRLAKRDGISLP